MTDFADLPRHIVPEDFATLVNQVLSTEPVPDNASRDKGQVTLTGAGGGSWTIGVVGQHLQLEPGTVSSPGLHVQLTVADWREVVAGRIRDTLKAAVGKVAVDPKMLAKLYRNADKVEAMKGLAGDLQLVIDDREENQEFKVTLATGGQTPNPDAPLAKVTVALTDLVDMAAGRENPQTAFFTGKIRIDGDMNYVMGLFATLMTP